MSVTVWMKLILPIISNDEEATKNVIKVKFEQNKGQQDSLNKPPHNLRTSTLGQFSINISIQF